MKKFVLGCLVASTLAGFNAMAGEKTVLHCIVFTENRASTEEDLDSFTKATDDLARKIAGIRHLWRGPMLKPVVAGTTRFSDSICMEMDGKTLLALENEPAFKTWNDLYKKVKMEGAFVFDVLGQ